MAKPPSPFAGMSLTSQTPFASVGPDQRLFAPSQPPLVPPAKPSTPAHQQGQTVEPRKPGSTFPHKYVSTEPHNHGSVEPRKQGTTVPGSRFDIRDEAGERYTLAFTLEELEALEDLKRELRRRFGVKTQKYNIIRHALHELIEDFERNGEQSILIRRIRAKTT
jgi:hypothetical protein